jgi:1-acyl-sn-glycerol-3-phosphate acyltransferase
MQAGAFAQHVVVAHPGRISRGAEAVIRGLVAPLVRLCFRPTLEGVEHLPTDRPYLLVANHSAGVGAAEIACIATLWMQHFGTSRPLAGFALPLGFVVWPLSAVHRAIGTVPSTYAAARAALAQGVPLLVFPGGDHESLKPIWQNHRVDFAGRVGFLRIALESGVPIVPLGVRNGAWTAPILLRSRWLSTLLVLPRLMGVKRWGLSLLGVLVATLLALTLPLGPLGTGLALWLWLGSPFIFLPVVPATLRLRIGPPLTLEELFSDGPGEEALPAARARVEQALEALIRRSP